MCGSLRHSHWANKDPIKIGTNFPDGTLLVIEQKKLNKQAFWNGFAREETLNTWQERGWKSGYIYVESFTEQGKEFTIPTGYAIKVVALPEKNRVPIAIVTRDAITQEERAIHPRFPVTEKIDG